ncbi:hypothetical protein KCU65_g6772, partial [Aureobasidium melanogenum]
MATRSVSPEKHGQAQDAPATSEGASGNQSGHPGSHPSAEHQQHQYHTHASEPGRSRTRPGPSHTSEPDRKRIRSGSSQQLPDVQPSDLSSHNSRQPTDARPSSLAFPPKPSEDIPVTRQLPAPYAPQAPLSQPSASVQPSPHRPQQASFPPYAMFGHQPTNRVYPNPPTNVSLAVLQRFIPWIDQGLVRDYLAIAAIRHKDIHEMVIGECERIEKEHQRRKNEDASVLSFAKEYRVVRDILYREYDNLPESTKDKTLIQTLDTINRNIMAIPPRVRPESTWNTKFDAFLNLIWIGTAIVDGRGMLPNIIRARMTSNGSELVKAIEHVYNTMSKAEILDYGAYLLENLVQLDNSRKHCFEDLERVVYLFQKVMQQDRKRR